METLTSLELKMRRLAQRYVARMRRDRIAMYRTCDGLTDAICRRRLPSDDPAAGEADTIVRRFLWSGERP